MTDSNSNLHESVGIKLEIAKIILPHLQDVRAGHDHIIVDQIYVYTQRKEIEARLQGALDLIDIAYKYFEQGDFGDKSTDYVNRIKAGDMHTETQPIHMGVPVSMTKDLPKETNEEK